MIVAAIVTPSRLFTTPPPTISITPTTISMTSSVMTPTLTVVPEIEESDDELPLGAVIGITVGAIVIAFIALLITCGVAKR